MALAGIMRPALRCHCLAAVRSASQELSVEKELPAHLLLPALKLLWGRDSAESSPFSGDSSFGNSMQPLLVNPRIAEGTMAILTGLTLFLDFSRRCKAVNAKGMLRTTGSHLTPAESPQRLAIKVLQNQPSSVNGLCRFQQTL